MGVIDHSSYIPLYVQVIQSLTERIENGTFKEGEQIPSENALAAEFGVSRITVTNAIQRMVQEGTLYRIQGKGTFVSAKKKVEHRLSTLISFTDDMLSRGLKPSNRILDFGLVVPPERVREKLRLSYADQTWKLRRVRLADDEPIAIQTAYLPEKLFPGLDLERIKLGSLYKALTDQFQIKMLTAEESYRVMILRKEEEAMLLNVALEAPALYSLRISELADGTVFEYTESILRGDRYILTVKMKVSDN